MSYWRNEIKPLLDAETGTIFKQAPIRVTLAFPNRYSVGMASLGYQVIYRMFNQEEGVACERAFLPEDPEAFARAGQTIPTVESGRPAGDCQLFAMSVSFELDLTNIIRTLDLSGMHPLREERDENDPIVMIGGPFTSSNPYPLTPFADLIIIGDGEQIVPVVSEALRESVTREDFFDLIDGMPGVFIPSRHVHEPKWATAPKELLPAYSQIVTPHSELSNMFLVEAQRGCPRPCTFCLARTMYGPNRNNGGDELLERIPDWATKVGLVGAALSDFPHTKYVGRQLTERGIKLGVSSIRADTVDEELATILKAGGLRTFTVASDAPSERLRRWLKKGITTEDLLKTAQISRDLGFSGLKVYMMIGLGPENDDDITELISFTKDLAKVNRIALGISPFVPKRHTPHFADPFAGVKTIEGRLKRIQKELRTTAELRNVSAKWAWVESVIARGGPEVGMAAYAIYKDESIGAWKKALDEIGWNDEFETNATSIELPPGRYVSRHEETLAV
ncbi:B12-binding domain-containing radical SAM protein [Deinococcus maricopensis]|uniref:Radical SAM domain protein n=1 Tax=Deinococcus maricopensis (strain DSM 21211 / LMG 22137 / NRRL B-23946 / LB-34) TaxID=709986 RepID=E8U7V6_DEIML|nr:radical SAM protein [Deinococcus maricopensis]ADV67145.1 Radical SAM domain protein [Deinococcus maricopensis DSM 21211]